MITIREIYLNEAEKFLDMVLKMDNEADYLLFSANERAKDIELTKKYIEKLNNNPRAILLVAVAPSNNFIGYIAGEVPHLQKMNHVMRLNLGLLSSHQKKGIDRELLAKALAHAQANGIKRVEATVIALNKLCINLCKRFGAVVEGVKRQSIKIGNEYCDEYLIAKLLQLTVYMTHIY